MGLKLKIKNNAIINRLASTTLAVYIMHDGLWNNYIWTQIFHTNQTLTSRFSIFYIIGSSIIIFMVCSIIDLIRQFIENKCEKIFKKVV